MQDSATKDIKKMMWAQARFATLLRSLTNGIVAMRMHTPPTKIGVSLIRATFGIPLESMQH